MNAVLGDAQGRSRDSPAGSRLPLIHVSDLPRYHQHAGSLAARLAMENGYVLDTSTGKLVGRIDVGEVLATLRGTPINRDGGEQQVITEETAIERPSGFFTINREEDVFSEQQPLAATG